MALINYSAVVADIRGKLGGSCFSKTKGGFVVYSKKSRNSNPTSQQSKHRAAFAYTITKWQGLTDEQRAAWNTATAQWPQKNVFGQTFFLSGQQLFFKQNYYIKRFTGNFIEWPGLPAPRTNLDPYQFNVWLDDTWIQLNNFATAQRSVGNIGAFRMSRGYATAGEAEVAKYELEGTAEAGYSDETNDYSILLDTHTYPAAGLVSIGQYVKISWAVINQVNGAITEWMEAVTEVTE